MSAQEGPHNEVTMSDSTSDTSDTVATWGVPAHDALLHDPACEAAWIDFQKKNNRSFYPEKERQKWLRGKFRYWAHNWLNNRWIIPPKPLGTEEFLFAIHPAMKKDWEVKRQAIELSIPSEETFKQKWIQKRKKQFQNKWHRNKEIRVKESEDREIDKEVAVFCHLRHNRKYWTKKINFWGFVELLLLFTAISINKLLFSNKIS